MSVDATIFVSNLFFCILSLSSPSSLLAGYPLFPGENEMEQMACIMEIIGVPQKKLIDAATRKQTFFEANHAPKLQPNSRGKVFR